MRPRVFPAEDARGELEVALVRAASMRPRVFPAEDVRESPAPWACTSKASMRPRVFPAEDLYAAVRRQQPTPASMRPRVFPAEDPGLSVRASFRVSGFNEAAGIPRGRRTPRAWERKAAQSASMRPRVFPAEDSPERGETMNRRIELQ